MVDNVSTCASFSSPRRVSNPTQCTSPWYVSMCPIVCFSQIFQSRILVTLRHFSGVTGMILNEHDFKKVMFAINPLMVACAFTSYPYRWVYSDLFQITLNNSFCAHWLSTQSVPGTFQQEGKSKGSWKTFFSCRTLRVSEFSALLNPFMAGTLRLLDGEIAWLRMEKKGFQQIVWCHMVDHRTIDFMRMIRLAVAILYFWICRTVLLRHLTGWHYAATTHSTRRRKPWSLIISGEAMKSLSRSEVSWKLMACLPPQVQWLCFWTAKILLQKSWFETRSIPQEDIWEWISFLHTWPYLSTFSQGWLIENHIYHKLSLVPNPNLFYYRPLDRLCCHSRTTQSNIESRTKWSHISIQEPVKYVAWIRWRMIFSSRRTKHHCRVFSFITAKEIVRLPCIGCGELNPSIACQLPKKCSVEESILQQYGAEIK